MHARYKILRLSDAGRSGIIGLMQDSNAHVRLWAAAHSLAWSPDQARVVLAALRDRPGPGSFDAGVTLAEFDNGTLTFDYD